VATTTIRRFGVLSVGKIMGLTYALIGLIAGALFSLFAIMGSAISAAAADSSAGLAGMLFGAGAIIMFPIFYGILGFIGGLLTAAIYNLVAGFTGGIEMELAAPATAAVPVGSPGYA
jgi:hypothetical protein